MEKADYRPVAQLRLAFAPRVARGARPLMPLYQLNLASLHTHEGTFGNERKPRAQGKKGRDVVTRNVYNHVSEILDWKYEDLGTVEGTLEVVSAHNGYEIRLYEPVWLQPVRCTFDEDLLEDALRNFKRRVEVSGLIRYTKDGMPVSAKVLKIEPMPDPSQLPSWREVKGILRVGRDL